MFSCFWWAVDEDGRCWCYRHYEHSDLIVQEATRQAIEHTLPGERIGATYAPPDMWNRMKDTGRTMAELFAASGMALIRSDNNRVQGHMVMKSMLAPAPVGDPYVRKRFPDSTELPMLMFLDSVEDKVFSDIESIQSDDDNPNDCAKTPHDLTHVVDGVRYFVIARTMAAERERQEISWREEHENDDGIMDYDGYMTGGRISASYIGC